MTDSIDNHSFRSALGSFATGVTIVTTRGEDGRDVGLTANSFNSVSLDPPMVLWSLARTSGNLAAFSSADEFAVHILAADQEDLSNRFASKASDKFEGLELGRNQAGVPLLCGCSALFQCRTAYRYDGGDHVIFVGEVIAFDHLDKPPLVFHGGRYATARPKPQVETFEGEIGETGLGQLVSRAYLHLVAPLRRNAENAGLSAPERYMMNVLLADANHELDEINAIISHTGIQVTPAVAGELVERGLVCQEGDDGVARFRLTSEGRELMVGLLAAGKAIEADALSSLSDDEQHLLRELLMKFGAGLSAQADARATRHLDIIRRGSGKVAKSHS